MTGKDTHFFRRAKKQPGRVFPDRQLAPHGEAVVRNREKSDNHRPFRVLSEPENFATLYRVFTESLPVMRETFDIFLIVMASLALVVFIALHFFEAGTDTSSTDAYGPPIPNKIGWVLMESPVFIFMCILWAASDRMWQAGPLALFLLFQAHYFQRSFIFPLLLRGNSRMPLGIVLMGMVFNTLNALMQGGWIFWVSPDGYYNNWFAQPYIYIGGALFIAGMGHQPPLRPDYPPPPQPGDNAPLHPPRRHVPLRLLGQLFRRAARMGRLRRSLLVVGRGGLRLVDLRQPRTPRRIAPAPLRTGVRRGVFKTSAEADHTLYLLIRVPPENFQRPQKIPKP